MKKHSQPNETVTDFASLIAWYVAQCDGEWEHRHGIKLETLDNPGWLLTVDLIHTDLQGCAMEEISEGCCPSGNPVSPRWIACSVKGNVFRGGCDSTQVTRLFSTFDEFRMRGSFLGAERVKKPHK